MTANQDIASLFSLGKNIFHKVEIVHFESFNSNDSISLSHKRTATLVALSSYHFILCETTGHVQKRGQYTVLA